MRERRRWGRLGRWSSNVGTGLEDNPMVCTANFSTKPVLEMGSNVGTGLEDNPMVCTANFSTKPVLEME